MYLEDRQPLPINYNPQITMNDNPNPAKNKQAERAASLIAAGSPVLLALMYLLKSQAHLLCFFLG